MKWNNITVLLGGKEINIIPLILPEHKYKAGDWINVDGYPCQIMWAGYGRTHAPMYRCMCDGFEWDILESLIIGMW